MSNAKQLCCLGCKSPIVDLLYLRCCLCEGHYDLVCANISENRFYNTMTAEHKSNWRCVACLSKIYIPRSDTTPVTPIAAAPKGYVNSRRGASLLSPVSPMLCANQDSHNLKSTTITLEVIASELCLFRTEFNKEMQASRAQLEMLNNSFSKLVSRVESCETRLQALTCRMDDLDRRIDDREATNDTGNVTLLETVEKLKADLNQRDQEALLNDVEISGITEHKNENLQHTMITLAQKIGVSLSGGDIVHASRAGPILNISEGGPSPRPRPRPVVVTLARRSLRDDLLKAARVRRGATTEGTDIPGPPRRFYINERLTRFNRLLFRRARELGDQHRWRFVWTRDGRIYARQHSGGDAPRHRIRVESDLSRVFQAGLVRTPQEI